MKFNRSQALLGAFAPLASAFPAAFMEAAKNDPAIAARAADIYKQLEARQTVTGADAATAIFEPIPIFEESQLIDVSDDGPNPWQAPKKSDLRGPCPGLNAFANHGFLPRNGLATIAQFIEVTTTVVGMGTQLAAFLAVLGASIDGDGTEWSIGGTPPASFSANPLADQSNGISGSHNKYESDASPCRPDLYQTGNDYKMQPSQFNQLIQMSPGGLVTLDSLTAFRSSRFDTQKATNPYFFNGPFTGVLVQPAAYTFIYRFMANHSEAAPHGALSYSVLADWFGMTKKGNKYVLKNGKLNQERIPYNWYRRAEAYPYDNEYFLADAAAAIGIFPKFADIGGNTGTAGQFTGVDIGNLTGGVMNGQDLLNGTQFACLAYQFSTQVKPDVALGTLSAVQSALSPLLGSLDCPTLEAIDQSQLEQFPGYTRSGVAPSS